MDILIRGMSLSAFAVLVAVTQVPTAQAAPLCNLTCTGLDGFIDGGRCFFHVHNKTTWYDAWTTCEQYGATLAHIHTKTEYDSITDMAWRIFGRAKEVSFWLALQRPDTTITNCTLGKNQTYWYDNPSTLNPKMRMDNTWAGDYVCRDPIWDGEYYYGYQTNNEGCKTPTNSCIGDLTVDATWGGVWPLCILNVEPEKFTKVAKCITNTPILTSTVADVQACADACATQVWCRSFNFRNDVTCGSNTCELYTYSTDPAQNCTTCPTTSTITDCYHYNYVP